MIADRLAQVPSPAVRASLAMKILGKAVVKTPIAVYIEKVYDDGNFAGLGL